MVWYLRLSISVATYPDCIDFDEHHSSTSDRTEARKNIQKRVRPDRAESDKVPARKKGTCCQNFFVCTSTDTSTNTTTTLYL